MNSFDALVKKSKAKWDKLVNSDVAVVYLGTASCGKAAGAEAVKKAILAKLKASKVSIHFVEVGCIGPCYLEPLMDIALPGSPRISYANVNVDSAKEIIENHIIKGKPVKKKALGHFGQEKFDGIERFFDLPMFKPQVRNVLKNCGFIDPENISHYLAHDGYQGLQKALETSPKKVIEEISNSGLRGRGGAGFPTGRKWGFCRDTKSDIKYVICNADEGDPGAFMDRSLIEGDPHAVLEGMLIAAFAVGASKGYIYIRAEYPLAIKRLKKAIEQARNTGLLGENILGSEFCFDVQIKEGAGAFVCGEETSLIHSIEGQRGMPRSRPPFPVISGLHDKPTLINNVETLGNVPGIIRNGSAWYKKLGVDGNHGTKTFSLVGKVNRTGLIEVPLGITLREIIFDIGGGTDKSFKAVQTGGPSGGCIPEKFLDIPVTYESLAEVGSIMGSGGLVVMDTDTCVVDVAKYFLEFVQNESCGKCTPCRVGTRHMVEALERICNGKAKADDIDTLESLAKTIKATSLCGLGQTAPNPVLTTLKYFKDEYSEHTEGKYCPALVCGALIEYGIDPEKCIACQQCVKVCPTNAITGKRPDVPKLDVEKCVKCRACYEICPVDAIIGKPAVKEPR